MLGIKTWFSFTYEKLPKICYKCGRITHGDQGCNKQEFRVNKEYGSWLRVEFICNPI